AARGARDAHARARRLCVGAASARRLPRLPGLDPWNRRIDRLPVAADSNAIIASIGGSTGLHADFGSGRWDGAPIGIPITVVGRSQPNVRVRFEYSSESDRGPHPSRANVATEGGRASDGDGHASIV